MFGCFLTYLFSMLRMCGGLLRESVLQRWAPRVSLKKAGRCVGFLCPKVLKSRVRGISCQHPLLFLISWNFVTFKGAASPIGSFGVNVIPAMKQ